MKPSRSVARIYEALLERFGEPIGKQETVVGAKDEGPGGKKLWNDEPLKDTQWSCPHVIREGESCCEQCGMMPTEMDEGDLDEKAPPGREKQVKALKKEPGIDNPYAVAWAQHNKEHKK